jgi:hypothetical protein
MIPPGNFFILFDIHSIDGDTYSFAFLFVSVESPQPVIYSSMRTDESLKI